MVNIRSYQSIPRHYAYIAPVFDDVLPFLRVCNIQLAGIVVNVNLCASVTHIKLIFICATAQVFLWFLTAESRVQFW